MNWWELKAQIAFLRKQGEDVKKTGGALAAEDGYSLGMFSSSCWLELLWEFNPIVQRLARSFGQSVVMVFVYYLILSLGSSLGEGGQLPASISVWLVNFVLGGWGIYLLWKSGR